MFDKLENVSPGGEAFRPGSHDQEVPTRNLTRILLGVEKK